MLPLDVEPYGPGDSECSAARRLLRRTVQNAGRRFADCVVAEGESARAPFLHDANALGLSVVVRLKNHLPELFAAAQPRFRGPSPHPVFSPGQDWVEIWDADDFDPWETLRWQTVRELRYRPAPAFPTEPGKPRGHPHGFQLITFSAPPRASRLAIFPERIGT